MITPQGGWNPLAPTSEPESKPPLPDDPSPLVQQKPVKKRLNTLGLVLFSTFIWFMFNYGFPLMRNLVQRANNEQVAPFLHAAATGDLARVKALLDAKADVNAKDGYCVTALMWASMKGHPDVVRALLNAGANVNAEACGGLEGFVDAFNTALMFASENDHPDVVRVLLNAGADVNAKGHMDHTALMLAALAGSPDVVRVLLNAGADVNAKALDGRTALTFAALAGRSDAVQHVVKLLKTAGAR